MAPILNLPVIVSYVLKTIDGLLNVNFGPQQKDPNLTQNYYSLGP